MEKNYFKSHRDVLCTPCEKEGNVFAVPYAIMGQEQTVEAGRLVNKTVKKMFDPVENNKGLKAQDFYLENILAVGATDLLHPVFATDVSLDNADRLDGVIDELFTAIDNNTSASAE